MRNGGSKQTIDEAKDLANRYVRDMIEKAKKYEELSKKFRKDPCMQSAADVLHEQSLLYLGYAIHTLQDSTSPSHMGFQAWNEDGAFFDHVGHIIQEIRYPYGNDKELVGVTKYAYDIFTGKKEAPKQFFK